MSITVIGNVNVDLVVWPAESVPPPGTEWSVERIEMRVGGAAGITALALAALGSPPRLVGCVGDDPLGRVLVEELAGIRKDIAAVSGAPTGVSVAFEAPGRDRSFLISLGCLTAFQAAMIPPDALSSAFVLVCGYFTQPGFRGPAVLSVLRQAAERGGSTLLDTGWDPAGWPAETKEEVRSLLPSVDVFLPNEVESHMLTGEEDPGAAARALHELSGGWAVVKLGAEGCVAAGPGGRELRVPAPSVEVVDTTGAGDAYNAGLIHARSRRLDWEGALAFATRVASTVVSRPSADRYPPPDQVVSG